MNKVVSLVVFAAFFTLACPFPSENRESELEWLSRAKLPAQDEELVTRARIPCIDELGLLKHYGVNLKGSHINCNQATSKRAESLFNREFRKRELEFDLANYDKRRDFGACCSPHCDWLLDYLEIDSSVVKCLDRK